MFIGRSGGQQGMQGFTVAGGQQRPAADTEKFGIGGKALADTMLQGQIIVEKECSRGDR